MPDEHGEEVTRIDYYDPGKVTRTDEGFLFAEPVIAKVGVLTYMTKDGPRNEFVSAEELFHPDSLDSAKMMPLTDLHPDKVMVTPDNAKEVSVGATGENVRQDGIFLRVPVKVTAKSGIQSVDNGRRQLSCGYRALVVKQDGIHNGVKYSHVQKRRRYNHLALVDEARAGAAASLHLDGMDAAGGILVGDAKEPGGSPRMGQENLTEVRLDSGRSYPAAPEVADELTRAKADLESTKAKLDAAEKAQEKLQANLDETKSQLEEAKKTDSADDVAKAARERIKVLDGARMVLDEKDCEKLDEKSDDEIRRAVIAQKRPKLDLSEKTDGYVQERFDAIVEGAAEDKQRSQGSKLAGDGSKPRNDGKEDAEKVRADALKAMEEESRKPLQGAAS
jgi:hypothetical protein